MRGAGKKAAAKRAVSQAKMDRVSAAMEKSEQEEGRKSKLAIVSDPHVGNHRAYGGVWKAGLNDRGRLSVGVLRQALRTAVAEGATHFIVAGDLFHTRRPEPAETAAVQRVLHEEGQNIGIVIVPGNHDMLDATAEEGNTACEPLWREATVVRGVATFVADSHTLVTCIPFTAAEPMRQYVPKAIAACEGGSQSLLTVLVAHVGVYDDKAPPWCKEATDGIHKDVLFAAMKAGGFDLAFVGNYHEYGMWSKDEMTIVQVGTLCPGSFSDEGVTNRGLVALYDQRSGLETREVPGPRFLNLPQGGMGVAGPGDVLGGYAYFVRQEAPPEDQDRPDETVIALKQGLASFEWVEPKVTGLLDDIKTQERPTEFDDAEKALTEYVGKMTLPDGIKPGDVLDKVREAWRTA